LRNAQEPQINRRTASGHESHADRVQRDDNGKNKRGANQFPAYPIGECAVFEEREKRVHGRSPLISSRL
jgi:hypothetical protein